MTPQIDFSSYRSLLCLNGDLPDKPFFKQCSLPIIAADGAANTLLQKGIEPTLIIGDLDSVSRETKSQYPHIKIEDQNRSDFQKALSYLKEHHLLPTIVLGVNGGYLDHILFNIHVLTQEECLFYDPPHMMGFVLKPGKHHYNSWPLMSKLSLMGAPTSLVTTSGLKWDLTNAPLEFFKEGSFFNRTSAPEIMLEVKTGTLLVMLYLSPINDAGSAGHNSHHIPE